MTSQSKKVVRFRTRFLRLLLLLTITAVLAACQATLQNEHHGTAALVHRHEITPHALLLQSGLSSPVAPLPAVELQKARLIQVPFVKNLGQMDARVAFLANTFHGTVLVTRDGGIFYSLLQYERKDPEYVPKWKRDLAGHRRSGPIGQVVLEERLLGGAPIQPIGSRQVPTQISSFRGADPKAWLTDIPAYGMVDYGEVYTGIDLRLRAHYNNVEKLFFVKPGAAPDAIRLQLRGATRLSVNTDGELEAETGRGTVRFTKPVAYQEIDGERVEVPAEYVLYPPGNDKQGAASPRLAYGFRVGPFDPSRELVIDPLLASTYLGGTDSDTGGVDFIDADGNLYLTCTTSSADFPVTPGAYDTTYNSDVVISKLDGSLTTLLASTFLGGSQSESGSVTMAPNGSLYVVGQTSSPDFPTTSGAYDRTYNGGGDIFVARLDPSLSTLQAATYLGGAKSDDGGLGIGPSGNLYISGGTSSPDFPTTASAYDRTYNGGYDMFIARLDPSLSTLQAATYLGSAGDDFGGFTWTGNFIDEPIYVYVVSVTTSPDLPTTPDAYDRTYNGGNDIYIARFDKDLTTLLAATYLGGSKDDDGFVEFTAGAAFVAGTTWSPDFPTTPDAYDPSYNGGTYGGDMFVAKLDESLSTLIASTYLGGSGDDSGSSLLVDKAGTVYTWGNTTSSDAPTTTGAYDRTYNGGSGGSFGDIYLARLDGSLSTLLAATYLGGADFDAGDIVHIGTDGSVLVAGDTMSLDYPTTSGAYDRSYNGGGDVIVSLLDGSLTTLKASTYLGGSGYDSLFGVLVSAAGDIYLSGTTTSSDFPTTSGAFDRSYNGTGSLGQFGGDLFIAKLDLGLGESNANVKNAKAMPWIPLLLLNN